MLGLLVMASAILELTVALGCYYSVVVVMGLREDSVGCRCVWPEEKRSRCGAGLMCQWVATSLVVSVMLLAGKETLLLGEQVVAAGWSSLLLVTAMVDFCCRCLAVGGKAGLCVAERVKGEQKGVKICLAS
ncbi:hypothetical protein NC653_031635 [Populus alba x Populus x berolinensis]|uniref:Uncharacterized protein n=1 Tax=Populus alba x Populus x berolinensis TaxID=444605 RepID=A0AAD6LZB0_9ROSI|nr:hypothetical protein NC653_031635 [Populus alba x Populus x berolinensis]